jgi:hypothetical protein
MEKDPVAAPAKEHSFLSAPTPGRLQKAMGAGSSIALPMKQKAPACCYVSSPPSAGGLLGTGVSVVIDAASGHPPPAESGREKIECCS